MRILANGQKKAGTHLLLKTLMLFEGYETKVEHGHYNSAKKPKKSFAKHFEIIRNPRNVLISKIRFDKKPITRPNILRAMPEVIQSYNLHLPALKNKKIFVVRFERLLTDRSELARIAKHLGAPLIERHFEKLWGNTATFTGTHDKPNQLSDWQEHWPKVTEVDRDIFDRTWERHGGQVLEQKLGYDPYKTYERITDGE